MPVPSALVGLASLAVLLVAEFAALIAAGRPGPNEVPVFDIEDLQQKHSSLYRAANKLGVFRLRVKGLTADTVLNASRVYFSQPDAVKRSARSASGSSGGFERGYIPLAGESGLRQFVELKEGFCYGREPRAELLATGNASGVPTCESLLVKPNAWPTAMDSKGTAEDKDGEASPVGSAWRHVLSAFLEECITLTDTLGVALSSAMGRDPALIGALAKGGEDISLMRLFHYLSPEEAPDLAPGVPRTGSSPHTDWHLLTIVLQDTTGGLQVRRPAAPYDWIDVPAEGGELIVILGDYLAALSDGRFVSPVHRVNLPPAPKERFSLTFFRYPRCAATIPEANARRAEERANRAHRKLRRHEAGKDTFNTLIATAPEGEGLRKLAARPFGELLVDKWNGVASNKRPESS